MEQLMTKIAFATGAPEPKAIPLAVARLLSTWQTFWYRYLHGPVPKVSASAIAVMSLGQFLDGSKAERDLGYRPDVSTDEAILRALEWFKAQAMVRPNNNS
jgi:dihydroflavonol-4-reductase